MLHNNLKANRIKGMEDERIVFHPRHYSGSVEFMRFANAAVLRGTNC